MRDSGIEISILWTQNFALFNWTSGAIIFKWEGEYVFNEFLIFVFKVHAIHVE